MIVEMITCFPAASLLQSLQAATSELAKLREYNFDLIRENVVCENNYKSYFTIIAAAGITIIILFLSQKFASQNRDLRTKYCIMKEELEEAQKQIESLTIGQELKQSSQTDSSQPTT